MQQTNFHWHLACLDCDLIARPFASQQQANEMSKTASLGLSPSAGFFGRLTAAIDRLLMASAAIAISNNHPLFRPLKAAAARHFRRGPG
jgi:hypothetical protein